MLQLRVFTGKEAGDSFLTRRFPVRIGRSKASDLQLEEPGVWDEHLSIALDTSEGFVLQANSDAITSVNGERVRRSVLRNGDIIEFGSQKVQFWLSAARQRDLRIWEWLVWILLAATCVCQIALIYRLP